MFATEILTYCIFDTLLKLPNINVTTQFGFQMISDQLRYIFKWTLPWAHDDTVDEYLIKKLKSQIKTNCSFGESWNCKPVCAVVHSYIFQGGILTLSCELPAFPPTHTCWSSKCHQGESGNSRREIQLRRDHTDVTGCTCKQRTPAMSQNNLRINYFKPAN